jgi:formylglycine-generating enzyme required for sulfatase activity
MISNIITAQNEIPNMVFVKGGTFEMGSNTGYKSAKPIHSVTLSDFYISN